MDTNLILKEEDRVRLDEVVQKMVANKEPDSNIRFVVNDFKKVYGQPKTALKEKTPGMLGSVSRFLGTEELGVGLGKALFQLTPEARDLNRLLEQGKISPEEYENITTGGITNKEVAGSALQTAATFIPGASKTAPLAAKVATGAGTGYAFDIAGGLRRGEETTEAIKPGIGTAIGGLLPILGRITGLDDPSKLAKEGSVKLERISERLTPVEKQQLAKQGKDTAEFIAKKKITGSPEKRYSEITNLYNKMEEKVQDLVSGSNKTYLKKDIVKQISQIPKQYIDNPTEYSGVVAKVDNIVKNINNNYPNLITAKQLNAIKRKEFASAYSKNATDVINEVSHNVGEIAKSILDTSISGLKRFNEEYGNIITAKKVLFKAMSRPQIGLTGKAVSTVAATTLGGAAGGTGGATVGALVGPQIGEQVFGTAVRSQIGKQLRNLSDLSAKLSTAKVGNIQITQNEQLALKGLLDLMQGIR